MSEQKILLLVEGEKTEEELFNHFYNLYGLSHFKIISYRTNIYSFYYRLKKDYSLNGQIDYEMIDIPLFLNEYFNLSTDELLDESDFSEIILIFDLDPQDPSFSLKIVLELMGHFNNSTELGKLYLNYPMVESFQHLHSLPDPDFNDRTVKLETLTEKVRFKGKLVNKYKKEVEQTTFLRCLSDIHSQIANALIEHHSKKIEYITGTSLTLDSYQELCESQCEMLQEKNSLHVVNTSILHLYDEYGLID